MIWFLYQFWFYDLFPFSPTVLPVLFIDRSFYESGWRLGTTIDAEFIFQQIFLEQFVKTFSLSVPTTSWRVAYCTSRRNLSAQPLILLWLLVMGPRGRVLLLFCSRQSRTYLSLPPVSPLCPPPLLESYVTRCPIIKLSRTDMAVFV